MFEKQQEIEFHYPASTHVRYIDRPLAMRPRQLVVLRVRDLVAEPLTPAEFLRRPYVRRSRWLVFGSEPGQLRFRNFYAGCSADWTSPSQLRLGLYLPGSTRPSKLIYRPFEPTVRDRDVLRRLLWRIRDQDFGGLTLGVYADDLRLSRFA